MRIARVRLAGREFVGRVEGGPGAEVVVPLAPGRDSPGHDPLRYALADHADLAAAPAAGAPVPLADATLLAPLRSPEKILAIGLNYRDHARESGIEAPRAPIVFAKMPNSLAGPEAEITWAAGASTQVDYEAELAVVIGRPTHRVTEANALDHVLGYTVCNDVSARDAQFGDKQWIRGKSFDTFCPLGPWIVGTDEIADPQRLAVRSRLNGRAMQDGSTADMIFSVAELVSYISRYVTLVPGDVIATGTPAGVGFARNPPVFLGDGDTIEVEVDRVGTLRNTVVVTP